MDSDYVWLSNYLEIFQANVELGTDISDWVNLDFCLPNFKKSSKEHNALVFPPNCQVKGPIYIFEIIMVSNHQA